MPNLRVDRVEKGFEVRVRRFMVRASREVGSAVSAHGNGANIHRQASIGPRDNILLIDLCLDDTGEVRTYREDALEEIKN